MVSRFNPSNAEATFIQSTVKQRFLKKTTTSSKSCNVGIHWIDLADHSDEYPCARVSVIFQVFASFRIGQIGQQQHYKG